MKLRHDYVQSVRFTEEEADALKKLSDKIGRNLSRTIRIAVKKLAEAENIIAA